MPIARQATSGGLIPWRSPTTLGTIIPFRQPARYTISGVTQDKDGVALGNCTVEVYETVSGLLRGAEESDTNGNYLLHVTGGEGLTFFVVAYKTGAPDVAGTTVNTLVGVES